MDLKHVRKINFFSIKITRLGKRAHRGINFFSLKVTTEFSSKLSNLKRLFISEGICYISYLKVHIGGLGGLTMSPRTQDDVFIQQHSK